MEIACGVLALLGLAAGSPPPEHVRVEHFELDGSAVLVVEIEGRR